jgi:hypothetical protein
MDFGRYVVVDLTNDFSCATTFCLECDTQTDFGASQKQALATGISFAHCGDIIFQVVQCHEPGCRGRFVFRSSLQSPALDMRELILMPHIYFFDNYEEQKRICQDWNDWPSKLKFEFRKAWDEKYVSQQEFIERFQETDSNNAKVIGLGAAENSLYQSSEKYFWQLFKIEYTEKRYFLKRFYPKTPFYNSLITCVALNPITDPDPLNTTTPFSDDDLVKKKDAYLYLLKIYNDQDIYAAVKTKLNKHEIVINSEEDLKKLHLEIDQRIFNQFTTSNNNLHFIHEDILKSDCKAIKAFFKSFFDDIYHSICTARFLQKKRKELSVWTNYDKKGTALFVDAPMGLGKTYSIVEGLASQPDLSAVIFMPTKRLCQELRDKLARAVSSYRNKPPEIEEKISSFTDTYQFRFDEDDEFIEQYKEEYYLRRGIYLFDGINAIECPRYDEIINRYNSGYYRKADICKKCKVPQCRFLKHKKVLNNYRIVITTHYMYDFFYQNSAIRKWHILSPTEDIVEKRVRDYFIIDEDFILTNCYQPVSLSEGKLVNFVSTATKLFSDPDFNSDKKVDKECYQKTDLILGLAAKTMESSVIPPIDTDFEYPKHIKAIWNKSLKEQEEIIPEEILYTNNNFSYPTYVGDYLEILENAIRKGFVVQAFGTQPKNKTILLPNPKHYLYKRKDIPTHVFFDGTKLESKYIREKLHGLNIETLEIKIDKPLWGMKVYQNINTDLPKNRISENINKIKTAIKRIVAEHGRHERYFILTNKPLKGLIEEFVSEDDDLRGVYIVIEYFGNLRGLNTAKKCNVGIVLGSLILPDTVEVAMAFDLIYKKFRDLPPYPLKVFRNIWNWRGSVGTKKYKDDYVEVDGFSKIYRHSEYRQALARTRYLSHPVTFYIFSKEKIDSYEPFVSSVEKYNYCDDLFPPKPKRKDNKDTEIEQAVHEWLKANKSVSAMDIHLNFRIGRHTVAKYLRQMFKDGKIDKAKGYQKRYRLSVQK